MTLTALEFYSGIGGMHLALQQALPDSKVVKAFEINNIANDVYEYNFKFRPYQGNIGAFTARHLTPHPADLWLLAPPCQPYTRQGLQRDSSDARASSFLQLLTLLPHLPQPPQGIVLENVVGFDTSDTRNEMLCVLHGAGYAVREYILSPVQYGVPYSRPRYFCVAKKGEWRDGGGGGGVSRTPPMGKKMNRGRVYPISNYIVRQPDKKCDVVQVEVQHEVDRQIQGVQYNCDTQECSTDADVQAICAGVARTSVHSTAKCTDESGDGEVAYDENSVRNGDVPGGLGTVRYSELSGQGESTVRQGSSTEQSAGAIQRHVCCTEENGGSTHWQGDSTEQYGSTVLTGGGCAACTSHTDGARGNTDSARACEHDVWRDYWVPPKVLEQCADVIDVVFSDVSTNHEPTLLVGDKSALGGSGLTNDSPSSENGGGGGGGMTSGFPDSCADSPSSHPSCISTAPPPPPPNSQLLHQILWPLCQGHGVRASHVIC